MGGLNTITSTTNKLDLRIKFKFEDAPTLSLRYIPIKIENNAVDPLDYYKNNMSIFSLISGFKASGKNLVSNTTVMITSTSSKDNKPQDSTNYSLDDFTLREDLFFKSLGLTLSASVSHSAKNAAKDKTNITGLNFSGTHTLFDLWNNSLGINYTNEVDVNKKLTLYFSSGVPLWSLGDLYITAEQNFYKETIFRYGNNDEFILTATLSKSW